MVSAPPTPATEGAAPAIRVLIVDNDEPHAQAVSESLARVGSAHGRDHWPDAYTALVSGGGLKIRQVVGATNSKAEDPTERPYTPQALLATIYRHLQIDYSLAFKDYFGRLVHILSDARPIRELIWSAPAPR